MKKLYIDYDKLMESGETDSIKCSYIMHPCNNGIRNIREQVSFLIACRRCEDFPCVKSCPNEALKREDGIIKRSDIICVSCKTCAIACPFGTILPELLPYLTSRCDACINRLQDGRQPLCADTCTTGEVRYIEEDDIEDKTDIYPVGTHIIVRAVNWLDMYGIKK